MERPKIKPRERDTILQALRAGVVPRLGLQHVQVGRGREIEEMVKDVGRVDAGGGAIRFIIGEYGSGKTFFLNLVRLIALEKGMVVMNADLGPDRRLHASGGQARSLFAELARSIATRTKPEGGALASIVERFISQAIQQASENGSTPDKVIRERLANLEELHGGYDFAAVISRYWAAHEEGNEELKSAALRWLRGEYSTKTEARAALDVRTIIDDAGVYDHIKLYSAFVRHAGYKGLVVVLDEMVNLYKLSNSQARASNYEQILRILNDVLQGGASHLAVLMGGTPEFLMDTRRGLYSYQALQSRLAQNAFAKDGLVDLSGPVVRLANLTPEDMFVLLSNIRRVWHIDGASNLPDEALVSFMHHCSERIGEAYFRTPRNTVTAFINLLAILEQNPNAQWQGLLDGITLLDDKSQETTEDEENATDGTSILTGHQTDDELASFKL